MEHERNHRESLIKSRLRIIKPLTNVIIRPYKAKDEEAVKEICADTGFLGRPIEEIFIDRDLFSELMVEPYLAIEPETCIVSENTENSEIVGYLLGSTKKKFSMLKNLFLLRSGVKMLFNFLRKKYANHPRTGAMIKYFIVNGLREMPRTPGGAHLHISLRRSYQDTGLVLLMLKEFEDMLRKKGIDSYYAGVFSIDRRRSEELYRRVGFKIFDKLETDLFKPEIEEEVYHMCIRRKISL